MKQPEVEPAALKNAKPWEYALRFLFGGVITVGAGLTAHTWGPLVGGLFLAFPAILPASLTLVKQHDGRAKAVDDARGGRLGSVGLMVFALVVWGTSRRWPPVATLGMATLAWLSVATGLWWVLSRREAERGR